LVIQQRYGFGQVEKLAVYSEVFSSSLLLSLKRLFQLLWTPLAWRMQELFFEQTCCASQIWPPDVVQWVSKLSPREPGAGGTPAEGEHKEEMVPKIASASGSSENSEENPYREIFQSWLSVG